MTFTRMKNLLQTIRATVLLILLIGSALTAAAYDFASGGIYYNITSSTNMTVEVTYSSKTTNSYSGIVTVPEKVTYNNKTYFVTAIGDYAFVGCTGLEGVNFASDKTTTIGKYAFQGCNGLTSFVFPPHITKVDNYAFSGCFSITGIVFEETTSSLSLGYGCSKGSNYSLFYDCPLYSVFIGRPLSYNTDSDYGYSPLANTTLVKARFGNPVSSIYNYLFAGCKSLKILEYNSQCKPTTIGNYAFWGCTAMTESDIILPESIKTIGDGAFRYCTSLLSYTIPNHVTTVGKYAFTNCERLENIIISPSVTSIGNFAFNGCTALTGVTIEEGETTLSLGYHNNSETGDLGKGLFYDCPLYSVFIGRSLSYNTDKAAGYSPFANINSLVKAHLGNPITKIYNYLFLGCTSLSTIIYNNQCKPTSIGIGAFCNCRSLTWNALNLPQSVKTIGDYTFQNCTKFTSIIIKPNLTSIGNYAFNGCTSLTEVTIEESETTLSLGYNSYGNPTGKGQFYDCPLNSVFIGRPLSYYSTGPNYGYSPFANNTNLVKVRLGKKLTSIQNNYFYGCTSLDEVTSCAATPPTANANCFANYDARLYVPKNSVSAYRNANVWKDFTYITGVDLGDDDEPVVPGWVVGDVDGNGKVNIDDVTALIQLLLTGHL